MTSNLVYYGKKLLLVCILSVAALTMTQCSKSGEESGNAGSGDPIGNIDDDEYVDLGLISMTMWKSTNESRGADAADNYYTYDEAVATFGGRLPTREQFDELRRSCRWVWVSAGCYKVFGPNGNYIILPADGFRDCMGGVFYRRTYGFYWSSTPDGQTKAWYLNFYSDQVYMYNYNRCYANSVRLVKNVQDY